MSQNGKLMPNLDQHSTKLLNLTVLQRIDPFVEEILITAAHVTFYEFNIDLSQWSRKDVEGSLFVVKRNTQPRFQFIVMNRRNTESRCAFNLKVIGLGLGYWLSTLHTQHLALNNSENLVENLLGDFEYEVQIPYLLYRNAAQEVNGIWFYNARECEEPLCICKGKAAYNIPPPYLCIAKSLWAMGILNAYAKVPPKSKVSSTKSEFEELEAVPTMAVMDGPLEPSSSTTSNVADVPDDPSFVNFFSAAMAIGNTSNTPITGQPYQSSAAISSSSVPTHTATPTVPTLQIPSLSQSTPLIPPLDAVESISSSNRTAKLVKPSFFVPPPSSAMMIPPVSSSTPTAPPLHPAVNVHRPYGAPLLQPFPPPNPPLSLAPAASPSSSPNYGSVISREKVRDALMVLVQDNQFIDMVYRALLNAHQS
ncbi:mRNA-decapping enzyme-like protein [Glycine soja]|nr:mRNA-decapping enzyme-like protein [Glycine soja]